MPRFESFRPSVPTGATPLVVRGPAPVLSWTPPRLEPATDDTLMRLLELYRHTDVAMAHALEERIGLAAIARAGGMDMTPGQARPAGAAQVRAYFAESAGSAAKFMARPMDPASARSPSTAGIPTPTRAR